MYSKNCVTILMAIYFSCTKPSDADNNNQGKYTDINLSIKSSYRLLI